LTDLATVLQLIISGDSAGAVAAIKAVGDETDATAAKTAAANETQMKNVTAMGALTSATIPAVVGLAALTAVMGVSVDTYAKWGLAVIKGAALTGMSTEAYSKVVGELKAYNVNADSVTLSMKFLEKQTYAAEQGTATSVKAFTQLGISMQQVKTMSPADLLELVRTRLSECGNAAERTALMVQLFGRGSSQMILWATASQEQIAKVDAGLKSTGQILDEQHAKQLKEAGADWMKFKLVLQGLEITLAEDVIPDINKLLKGLTELMVVFRPFVGLIPILAAGFAAYLAVLVPVIVAVKTYELVTKAVLVVQELWTIAQVALAVATHNVTLAEGLQILTGKNLSVVTEVATVAETEKTVAVEADTVATEANSASMLASLGPMALVAAGIAVDVVLIGKAINAYHQMTEAIQQAAQANAGFNQNVAQAQAGGEAAKFGQLKGGQTMAQIQAAEKSDQYHSPGLEVWKWFASGGAFTVSRPTLIGVGESGPENVSITPTGNAGSSVSQGAGGGAPGGITVQIQNVFGTINRQIAMQWAEPLAQALGEKFYTTSHGAGH
jgi:hypothetical protein